MSIRAKSVWLDGKLVPFDQANVHVLSHTLHYGLGVFEGIRAYRQKGGGSGVFALDEHIRRFLDSTRMVQIRCPYTHDELREACLATLRDNALEEAYIRPLLFLGHGAMGLGARNNPVHVAIATWEWGAYLGDDGLKNGIHCGTSSFARHHPNASLQRAKVVGHYVNSILARYEAMDAGFAEAIMLDANGYVAEGTGENIFVIRDGAVLTPPVLNILAGITRDVALQILEHEGVRVDQRLFGRDALYVADEIFMTGTAAEVTPVRAVDHRDIGTGKPGPITRRVQETYLDGVRGEVDWMREWITRV